MLLISQSEPSGETNKKIPTEVLLLSAAKCPNISLLLIALTMIHIHTYTHVYSRPRAISLRHSRLDGGMDFLSLRYLSFFPSFLVDIIPQPKEADYYYGAATFFFALFALVVVVVVYSTRLGNNNVPNK